MGNEQKLLSTITHYLKELEIEAYGERKHGNKEMAPNLYHFKIYAKKIFDSIYSLNNIDGQEYFSKEHMSVIYDLEREVIKDVNYLIEIRTNQETLTDILPTIFQKIQRSLSCIVN